MQALRKAAGSSKELVIGMIPGDGIGRVVLPVGGYFCNTLQLSILTKYRMLGRAACLANNRFVLGLHAA